MNLLKKLLGVSNSEPKGKLSTDENETGKDKCLENVVENNKIEIKKISLNEVKGCEVDEIIKSIVRKRENNIATNKKNYEKAIELIGQSKFNAATELTQKDVLGYYEYYLKAESEEKKGNLRKACELYWYNIYQNGTDAPANFTRLLILLRKIEEYELELKIAEIYLNFANNNEIDKICKRIETIVKKLKSL